MLAQELAPVASEHTRRAVPETDRDLALMTRDWAECLRIEHGFPAVHATAIAQDLVRLTRQRFGGGLVYVHALAKPMSREDRDAKIRELFNGSNLRAVCEQLGVSRATVQRAVGPGAREKRQQAARERDARIAAAYRGAIDESLLRLLQLPYSTIHGSLRRQGLR